MDVPVDVSPPTEGSRLGRRRTVAIVLASVLIGASIGLFVAQVEVSGASATRTCGSAFDVTVDRSGWDRWWASDLDERDDEVRSALVRTRHCPAAVNRRIAIVATLAAAGTAAALLTRQRRSAATAGRSARDAGVQVTRLGRLTTWVGGGLTLAGVAAVVVLVADADSTLFLYTDRLVVGVVGLIVLMPAIALCVIGRVLTLVGGHLRNDEPGAPDA